LRHDLDVRTGQPVLALPQLTRSEFDVRDLEILADALALQVGEDGPAAEDLLAGLAGDPDAAGAS
jgi:hypothetical protein